MYCHDDDAADVQVHEPLPRLDTLTVMKPLVVEALAPVAMMNPDVPLKIPGVVVGAWRMILLVAVIPEIAVAPLKPEPQVAVIVVDAAIVVAETEPMLQVPKYIDAISDPPPTVSVPCVAMLPLEPVVVAMPLTMRLPLSETPVVVAYTSVVRPVTEAVPVTVRLPPVVIFVLMVVAADTRPTTKRTPTTAAVTTVKTLCVIYDTKLFI